MSKRQEAIEIIILYILLIAGGLWHILGWFQSMMSILASPLIIGISTYSLYKIYSFVHSNELQYGKNAKISKTKNYLLIFFIIVVFFSWLIEMIGVKTGLIFGEYQYGESLILKVFNTPIAIGFAWFSVIVSSLSILQNIQLFNQSHIILRSLLIGAVMTLFDTFMEPAAIKLDYWRWAGIFPPMQNYISWFTFGFIFSMIGYYLEVLKLRMPAFVFHTFWAQLLYFLLVLIS